MDWYAILPRVWNMSLTASVVVLVVLAARLVLRRAPAVFRYVLWGAVLFRLLCPVSFSSVVSVFSVVGAPVNESGGMEYVPENIVHTAAPEVELPVVGDTVNALINEKLPQGEEQLRADPLEAPVTLLTWLWMAGTGGMLLYGIVSWVRLRRQLVGSVTLEKNIRLADGIGTAFVLGVLRPVIWLPSAMPPAERELVIRHERQHLRHGDHVFRFLGWCALCLHWFNPLVWLAFRLSGKDMEHACDEAVMKKAERDIRAEYSYALLHCAAGRAHFAGTPLAFGENNVRSRIKNVMRYKKPAVLAMVLAVVLCAVLAVCLLANPKNDAEDSSTVTAARQELADAAPGDTVFFGTYEQDNYSSNGAEPIEWIVVKKQGSSVLLLSKHVLANHACDSEKAAWFTWEDCALREWLNGEFVVTAFSRDELEKLQWANVSADGNPVSGLDAGTATRDLVFIPSVREMTLWFDTDSRRTAQPTAYAAAQGAYLGEGVQWWLRTPGSSRGNAAVVDVDGSVDANGHLAWYPGVGVRPCIWLTVDETENDPTEVESFAVSPDSAGENAVVLEQAENGITEEVTVPTLEPVLAQQTIQLILGTLRVTEEHGVSFHIPSLPPRAEDGTELFITLNATYRLSDGSYTVQSLVDNVSGWVSGDAVGVSAAKQEGELTRIMLRAAYRTPVGENAYKEMAASYVQLTAPFDYNTAPVLEEPTASIEYRNGESRIHVNLQNGERAILSLALPEGFVLAENWEKSADPAMPPATAVLWQGCAVGTLRLYPFSGAYDDVDPAENELPMPIFAAVALANHVDYEGYTVIRYTDTGAAATAKYSWQQTAGAMVKDAAALPWNSRDCILAYDWSAMHCYMELVFDEDLVSAQELEKIAQSVRWQKNS